MRRNLSKKKKGYKKKIYRRPFQLRYGHYKFLVMSFEMINVPVAFMDLINWVFHPNLDKFVIAFIDTILVYSKSHGKHENHLCIILETLKTKKLYVKWSKCKFWLEQVIFLGHMVNIYGVIKDLSKIEAIVNWPQSTNIIEVQSFLSITE